MRVFEKSYASSNKPPPITTFIEGTGGGGGATVTRQRDELSGDDTTTSATFADTSLSITLANRTGGFFIASGGLASKNSLQDAQRSFRFVKGTTNTKGMGMNQIAHASYIQTSPLFLSGDLDGDALKIQFCTFSGTLTLMGSGVTDPTEHFSHLEVFEVS